MDEFQVTNGTVEYSRTIRPADYEGKTPKVSLSFTVAEGSSPEAVALKVMGIAFSVVERALATRPEQDVAPVEKLKQTKAKPVEPVIEESFETVVEGDTEEDDILGPPPGEVIHIVSDAEMHSQAQRTSAALKKASGNINKLRALINDCGGDGHLLQIPQSGRHVFMEKAKGLAAS